MNALVVASPRPTSTTLLLALRRSLVVIGPGIVVTIAALSAGDRAPMSLVDVALLLAVVTVVVALVSWPSGVTTSVAAGLSLDYFHTEPVHSLRITSMADVVAVLLLSALGISVSAACALRLRALARSLEHRAAASARAALDSTSGRVASDVWLDSVRAASDGLSMVECRVVAGSGGTFLPAIARHRTGRSRDAEVFVLPECGAAMGFEGLRSGHVVLTPRAGLGAVSLNRRTVTAFVDQLELALGSLDGTDRASPR